MYARMLAPLLHGDRRNVLLLGPRQVGKSTLLLGLSPDLVINLMSPASFRQYVSRPETLEQELRAAPATVRTVLLDEVQRVPALLDVLQVIIDEHPRRFRFLLSGSSARKLRRGHANLLPGRVHVHHLHPLVAAELGADFDLERVLAQGSLPGIWSEPDPAVRARDLRSYVDSYLREEIQAEALVRDVGGYGRLLELVAASSGRILNMNALGSHAGIGYETVRRYVEVIEDTLVAFRVPAWSGSDRKANILHPRIYFFDLGVRNALLRRPLDRALEDERGLLLEHFVAGEIQRRLGPLWPDAALFHYRTRGGAEVDFILQVGREAWAIEVKASRHPENRDLSGLASAAERIRGLRRRIVVFAGPRARRVGDVEMLTVEGFLRELPCSGA